MKAPTLLVKSFTNRLQLIFTAVSLTKIKLFNLDQLIMKTHVTLLALLAMGSLQMASAADITGKVSLKGTPKPEIPIVFDATCGKLHPEPVTTRHYVVSKDGGLANVVVYLKDVKGNFQPPEDKPILDQTNCMYDPYVMGVMTNQKFIILNSDPFLHNVNASITRNPQNKGFNVAQPIKGMKKEVSFAGQEVAVRFKCDVHPWMFAYVAVLDNPYFAITDKDGNFKISNVPPGKYTIVAYHVKTHGTHEGETQEVNVSGDTKVDFTIQAKQ